MPVSFSVVVPTHDRRAAVVRSVASALAQERPPLEVLVVCDGCTDGTQDALAALGDPRVVVLDLPKGPGYGLGNRNAAVERARGDVLAHLGDDDLWMPEHLAAVGAVWDAAGPGALDIVQSGAVLIHPGDDLEPRLQAWAGRTGYADVTRGICWMPIGTVSVTAAHLRAAGGWRDHDVRGGDHDLWRRCAAATAPDRIGTCAQPTLLWLQTSDRGQGYPDHVAQLERWAGRLATPDGVAGVRADLAVAWGDATVAAMSALHEARAALAWERQVHEEARAQAAAARGEADAALAALAWEREVHARSAADLAAARARVAGLRAREAELADALALLKARDADLAYLRGVEADHRALTAGRWHRLGRRLRRLRHAA